MKIAVLVVLAAALAACGKPSPPTAPTPEAVGAELATFPQLLVPISTQTWARMQSAVARNDVEHSAANQYPQPYAHGSVLLNGRDTPAFVAYTGVWLAPAPIPLQPMSVQQYLRTFAADADTNLAGVIAPKGSIFFTREQLPDVMGSARNAGASSVEMPYSLVRGAAK
jgi:hypothetical protein